MKKKELYAAPAAEVLVLSLEEGILVASEPGFEIPGLGDGGLDDIIWN